MSDYIADPRPFYQILHNLLRQDGIDYDPEKTAGTVDWVLTNSSILRKITSSAEWGCVQAFYAHWDKHKVAPTRAMMDTLLHQKQKCGPMLDVMSDYDKHAEDLEQVDPLDLGMYMDQRKDDYEKHKLSNVLSWAEKITIGAVLDPVKKGLIWEGPRDALKYLHQSFQEGILLDDAKSQGGDTATTGIKSVALRVDKAAAGYGNVIPTRTPIDEALAIGPESSVKYVGILGFSNQRKSTLLFTISYQAAVSGYKGTVHPARMFGGRRLDAIRLASRPTNWSNR